MPCTNAIRLAEINTNTVSREQTVSVMTGIFNLNMVSSIAYSGNLNEHSDIRLKQMSIKHDFIVQLQDV